MNIVHELFKSQPLLALFITIALGYLVGKIKIGSFVLGGIAGTLLVGVVIGQLGIDIDSGIKNIFFALFIYAVGFQGGPQFFHALTRVDHFCELRARARGGAEAAAGRFSFCKSGWRRSRIGGGAERSEPSACRCKPPAARVDHFCELRARARRSRGRRRPIFFLKSGWRRSGSVRRRRRAQRATGSTSPPAACTGKLMGLGRVLAPRFQPCPLSVGGTAPSAALAYFSALALALAVAVELRVRIAAGRSPQEGLGLRKSRVH